MIGIIKKLSKALKGQPERAVSEFPAYICMETTNACNLKCEQCIYHGAAAGKYHGEIGFIATDIALKALDELAVYKCGVMLNGDGETLLHKNFHDIASHAVSLNLPNVYFNTNGNLLTPECTDKFIKYFKGRISFSLDGFKESHERLRKGSSYDLVISNIEYLRSKVKELNLPIEIAVAYCNYDQPKKEKDEFVKYWIDKVDNISIGEVYNKDYQIVSDQINSHDRSRIMCGVPWETFILRWNGDVVACSNCFSLGRKTNEVIMGNIKDSCLYDIWHGKKFNKFRRMTEAWALKSTICEKCERWNMYAAFGEKEENGMLVSRSGTFTSYRRLPKK